MNPVQVPSNTDVQDSDADITQLLYKTVRSIKNLLIFIGRGFLKFGAWLLLILLFVFRNIMWVIIGAAVGLGYGSYKISKAGPEYTSEMLVKANFNSSRSLYNTIDYLNSLGGANKEQLSKLFEISPEEAGHIVHFAIAPVRSEIITSELYRDQFMTHDRTNNIRQDTFWTRTIKYEDFKESLTDFDFPYYTITVTANSSTVFPKLQKGLLQYVSNNQLLQDVKNRKVSNNYDDEKLIANAIKNLDTLRQVYNQRILNSQASKSPGGNQVTFLETSPESKIPELQLYDKMLELRDELKKTQNRSVTEKDIIEVYSPFSPVGQKSSIFNSLTRFLLTGTIISIIILVIIALYKSLLAFEASQRTRSTPASSHGN